MAANVDNTSERGKLRGLHKELYDLIGGRAPIAETTPTTAVKVRIRIFFLLTIIWKVFNNARSKPFELDRLLRQCIL